AGAAPQWNVKLGVGARSQTANSLGPVVGNDPSYIGLKPFLRTGLQHELDVSVSGGTDLLRYSLAAGQETAEGTLPRNDSRRVGIRGNLGFQPAPSLAVDVTSSFSNRRSRFLESGDNTYGFLLNVCRGTQDYTGGEHAM